MCEVSSLYAKRKWSYCAETVKSLKSKYDLDLLTPKSIEFFLWVMVNTCVKYHHCISKGKRVIVQKPLFHRQTYRQQWWNQHTPSQLCWEGYNDFCDCDWFEYSLIVSWCVRDLWFGLLLLCVYLTCVLVLDCGVPVWHDIRCEMTGCFGRCLGRFVKSSSVCMYCVTNSIACWKTQ